jgi:hypothetical protein
VPDEPFADEDLVLQPVALGLGQADMVAVLSAIEARTDKAAG